MADGIRSFTHQGSLAFGYPPNLGSAPHPLLPMAKIYLLRKTNPDHESWRGRGDADAVHVSASDPRRAREIAAKLNQTAEFPWKKSPWLSDLHAECELEHECFPYQIDARG